MSIVTTGINIVATGVSNATNKLRSFGQSVAMASREADKYANNYEKSMNRVNKSTTGLTKAMNINWRNIQNTTNRNLEQLEMAYDRTFRQIGNKYQSMIMGSVALSMSGISIKNVGTGVLGFSKGALDTARDFETVMKQIEFYGHLTNEELADVQKRVFQLGRDYPVLSTEIAGSALEAFKLGYNTVEDTLKMATEASKLMVMSNHELTGDESLKFLNLLRIKTGDAVSEVDKLNDLIAKTADLSASDPASLFKTIQSSRVAFEQLDADMPTFMTMMGAMSNALRPREAGMALSSLGGGILSGLRASMQQSGGFRGKLYNQLGLDIEQYNDPLKFIDDVMVRSKELWGDTKARMANLNSIFGKATMPMFEAIEQYGKNTSMSLFEMREEIKKSDGHAQELIDTLMNSSQGLEYRLAAVYEQFEILYGQSLRPAFNEILEAITGIVSRINEFSQAHPGIAKAIGYFVVFGGILATVTGGAMIFTGAILAIFASLANVAVQLARNIKLSELLGKGYSSVGGMLKGQFLSPVKLIARNLLKFSGVTLFMYMAWKNDFLRMRTTLTEWFNYTKQGLQDAQEMFAVYGQSSASEWNAHFQENVDNGVLDNWVTSNLLKLSLLSDGIRDIWSDGQISEDKYLKLKDMGLLPIIEEIYKLKTIVSDFWEGFWGGMEEGIRLVKDMLSPLMPIFKFIREKAIEILNLFGYFEDNGKGVSSKWEEWGSSLGVLVGSIAAIRIGLWGWVTAIKLIVSPFKVIKNIIKGIWDFFKKFKNIKLSTIIGKGLNLLGTGGRLLLPKALRPNKNKPKSVVTPGKKGSSNIMRSRTPFGRMKDFWYGGTYVPEERVDKKGRVYHQVRTGKGVTRTTSDGMVKGKPLRTGGMKGFINSTAKVGGKAGKGLLKGIGKVLNKGLPFIFKTAFRLIPFLGIATIIFDAIVAVWTNWDTIKNAAVSAWNWIKMKSLESWDDITAWGIRKWGEIKIYAGSKIDELKTSVTNIWSNLFTGFTNQWNKIKKFAVNNPVSRAVSGVVDNIFGGKGNRTGLWNVPKENYPAYLHKGEMVLTQKEAQIMRSLVGSDHNSISRFLLNSASKENDGISVKIPEQKVIKPKINSNQKSTREMDSYKSSDTNIQFGEGSIQISIENASQEEIKKGAKKMFTEFKRLVELENMKNYRSARPRQV